MNSNRLYLSIFAFFLLTQVFYVENLNGQVTGSGMITQAMGAGSFTPKLILKKKSSVSSKQVVKDSNKKVSAENKTVSQNTSSKKKTKSIVKEISKKSDITEDYDLIEVKEGDLEGGKITSLPKPDYPKAASAVKASGLVEVSITVDENGDVISAEAVSGHPLLKAAAVNAAKLAKFTPALYKKEPIKIQGIINYNFTL